MNTLYDTDLACWIDQQMKYLKNKQFDQLDIENLLEEMESMGKTEPRTIRSYFVILIAHLLKWEYQPEERSGSWDSSITNSRNEINWLLKDSPSLKNKLKNLFEMAWEAGLKIAIKDTGLAPKYFPRCCPWDHVYAMTKNLETINPKRK
jgi:hypothetical protein